MLSLKWMASGLVLAIASSAHHAGLIARYGEFTDWTNLISLLIAVLAIWLGGAWSPEESS